MLVCTMFYLIMQALTSANGCIFKINWYVEQNLWQLVQNSEPVFKNHINDSNLHLKNTFSNLTSGKWNKLNP